MTFSRESRSLAGVINLSSTSTIRHTIVPNVESALHLAARYREEGVEIIDISAQSSRYDSPLIGVDDELTSLIPAVAALVREGHHVSVETWRHQVARAALDEGAAMLNLSSGRIEPEMEQLLQASRIPFVVTYVEGQSPREVGEFMPEPDKPGKIAKRLRDFVKALGLRGLSNVLVDPGIGIAYKGDYIAFTRMQIDVLKQLDKFDLIDRPIYIGVPRKQELVHVIALATLALAKGANVLRIHDVEVAQIARYLDYV